MSNVSLFLENLSSRSKFIVVFAARFIVVVDEGDVKLFVPCLSSILFISMSTG